MVSVFVSTAEELQRIRQEEDAERQQQLVADAAAAAAADPVASAYSADQGFREISVQDLAVALAAGDVSTLGGGYIDLLLDVRSAEEFAAGEWGDCQRYFVDIV